MQLCMVVTSRWKEIWAHFSAVIGVLTLDFLGATSETFASSDLGGEKSLLADTGKIREATAVGRWAKALRNTFLLIDNVSLRFSQYALWTASRTHGTWWPIGDIGWFSREIGGQQRSCEEWKYKCYLKEHFGVSSALDDWVCKREIESQKGKDPDAVKVERVCVTKTSRDGQARRYLKRYTAWKKEDHHVPRRKMGKLEMLEKLE